MKYQLLKNKIPQEIVEYLQSYTLEVKERVNMHLGKEKPNGSGVYWQGLDMASSSPLSVDIEKDKLYSVYASHWMYDIITEYISEPYFFNDQIVVKEPHEDFKFEPHYDNQYGPTPDDKELVTINCMLILDDYTDENGAINVDGKTLYPKTGDILLIEGNTIHSSENNKSDYPRRAYICVYSNKPIGKDFQKGFYYHKFDDNSKI